MEFLLPVLKTAKVTTSKRIHILEILVFFTLSPYSMQHVIWYPVSVSKQDKLFLGSAQLIQLVGVPFRQNVPLRCSCFPPDEDKKRNTCLLLCCNCRVNKLNSLGGLQVPNWTLLHVVSSPSNPQSTLEELYSTFQMWYYEAFRANQMCLASHVTNTEFMCKPRKASRFAVFTKKYLVAMLFSRQERIFAFLTPYSHSKPWIIHSPSIFSSTISFSHIWAVQWIMRLLLHQ